MAANTAPIYSKNPRLGKVIIPQTTAVPKSDGSSLATGVELMYCAFKGDTEGNYLSRIRFTLGSATASTLSTATTLRIFITSVAQTEGSASPATAITDTILFQELAVAAVTCDVPTAGVNFFEIYFEFGIEYGQSILVTQHVAMANACNWGAIVFGGKY
jgi:hypothetical protein